MRALGRNHGVIDRVRERRLAHVAWGGAGRAAK
jgi:hypothetical protein